MTDQPQRIGAESGGTKSDPTALTTDALQREIAQLRELMSSELKIVTQSIADQKELRQAQIATLQQQLDQSERLRRELKSDNEKNIDRALAGVEKATEKLEGAFTRAIGQMQESNSAANEGVRRDIDSLKDRISDNRTDITGIVHQKVGAKEDRSGLYAAIAAFSGLVFLVIGVLAYINK